MQAKRDLTATAQGICFSISVSIVTSQWNKENVKAGSASKAAPDLLRDTALESCIPKS